MTMRRYAIEYYGKGRFVNAVTVTAKNRADALLRFRATGETVLEIICVRNLDEF